MKFKHLSFFLLITIATTCALHGMDYSRETGYKVASFVLPTNIEKRGCAMATIANFWQGKPFPLKKNQLPLEKYREKINTFKSLHSYHLALSNQMDPDWSTLQEELLKQPAARLLWVLNVGDFLVCESAFLDHISAALRKKLEHEPEQYEQLKKRIKNSAFKVPQVELAKLGTCVFDFSPMIEKGAARYTFNTVNFFAEQKDGVLILPEDNHSRVNRVRLDGKNNGEIISTWKSGNDSILFSEQKEPFLWALGKNDAPKTISVGAFTITNSTFSTNERLITVKKGAKTIAKLACFNASQILLNENCFVCAPTIREESDKEARSAIIINFKTGRHYRFTGEWSGSSGGLGLVKKLGSSFFKPTICYSNGTVFIRWAKKIDCFELGSEVHKIFDSGFQIMALQASPDGKYLVICDRQPSVFGIKNPLGSIPTLRYHIYEFKPKLTKLSHNLKKLIPTPESGIFAWIGSLWQRKTEWQKPEPENIFIDDAKKETKGIKIFESKLPCTEEN